MAFLTSKAQTIFAILTIPFVITELIDKIFSPIPNFLFFDIGGVVIVIVLSVLFVVWEFNKVILSHYPIVVALQDLGDNFYGISTGNIGQDGRPIEGALIIMLKRKGILDNLIRPNKITIKARDQFSIDFTEGVVVLQSNPANDLCKDGFVYKHFEFPATRMVEEMHSYAFRIRHPKNPANPANPVLGLQNLALSNYAVKLDYKFGFFRCVSFSASEEIKIRGR
jgi:hypothetical protein